MQMLDVLHMPLPIERSDTKRCREEVRHSQHGAEDKQKPEYPFNAAASCPWPGQNDEPECRERDHRQREGEDCDVRTGGCDEKRIQSGKSFTLQCDRDVVLARTQS